MQVRLQAVDAEVSGASSLGTLGAVAAEILTLPSSTTRAISTANAALICRIVPTAVTPRCSGSAALTVKPCALSHAATFW